MTLSKTTPHTALKAHVAHGGLEGPRVLLPLKHIPDALLIAREVRAFPVCQGAEDGAVANARLIDLALPQEPFTREVVVPDVIHNRDVLHIMEQTPSAIKDGKHPFPERHIGAEGLRKGKEGGRCRGSECSMTPAEQQKQQPTQGGGPQPPDAMPVCRELWLHEVWSSYTLERTAAIFASNSSWSAFLVC